MKKAILIFCSSFLLYALPVNADIWGGDVAVLLQILSNALQQLAELKGIVDNGRDNIELIRDINKGISDSLSLMRTISPNTDPGLYKDWEKTSDALSKLEDIYGVTIDSKDSKVQHDADQTVAEAISLNNTLYKYTKQIDEIGELIKSQSHSVSPGGAAKLTAQSLGVMLNLQNEMLRTQATGLKLQAQTLALQNRKDKERTKQMVNNADQLKQALGSANAKFELPRFE